MANFQEGKGRSQTPEGYGRIPRLQRRGGCSRGPDRGTGSIRREGASRRSPHNVAINAISSTNRWARRVAGVGEERPGAGLKQRPSRSHHRHLCAGTRGALPLLPTANAKMTHGLRSVLVTAVRNGTLMPATRTPQSSRAPSKTATRSTGYEKGALPRKLSISVVWCTQRNQKSGAWAGLHRFARTAIDDATVIAQRSSPSPRSPLTK